MEHDRVPSLAGLPLTEKLKDGSGGEAAGEEEKGEGGLTPCEVVAVRLAEDAQTAVGGPRVQGGEGRGGAGGGGGGESQGLRGRSEVTPGGGRENTHSCITTCFNGDA